MSWNEKPKTGHSAPDVASAGQSRGEGSLLLAAGHVLFNASQDTIGLLGLKGTLLAHGWSTRQPGPSPQRSSPAGQTLTCTDTCSYFSLGVGLCACLCHHKVPLHLSLSQSRVSAQASHVSATHLRSSQRSVEAELRSADGGVSWLLIKPNGLSFILSPFASHFFFLIH